MVYTKEDFKRLWEANEYGSGINYDDIADCAVAWGISESPRIRLIGDITYRVLKAAGVIDAEKYNPNPDAKFDLFLTKEQREVMQKYIDQINALGEEIRELKITIAKLVKQRGGDV